MSPAYFFMEAFTFAYDISCRIYSSSFNSYSPVG
jgi:hypothetical protein